MIDVFAGALLAEQAGFEKDELGARPQVARRVAVRRALPRPTADGCAASTRGPSEAMARFDELQDGALVDDRV